MRMMIKFSFPVKPGNELVSSGKLGRIFQSIMEDLKPEAAYFFPENGQRSGLLVVNMTDSSDLVKSVEPLWHGLHADVSVTPVMNGEDLKKGLTGMEGLVKRYA
jgi:Domain of unknown function (DUF3303)